MAITILTEEQRERYGQFLTPPTTDQLARYFFLDAKDRELIRPLRGAHNQIGFAVLLGCARFLGTFPNRLDDVPDVVRHSLAKQLGEPPDIPLGVYQDSRQRWRHAALIREHYGFLAFEDAGVQRLRLARWLYALCWAGDDRPSLLFDRATNWLVENKVLLPGATTLERFVGQIRHRAQQRLWQRLAGSATKEMAAQFNQLLDLTVPGQAEAFENLRALPQKRSPMVFLNHLARIDKIRALGPGPKIPAGIPAGQVDQMARQARQMKVTALAALTEPRRTATLIALFHSLEALAQDEAVELAESLGRRHFPQIGGGP